MSHLLLYQSFPNCYQLILDPFLVKRVSNFCFRSWLIFYAMFIFFQNIVLLFFAFYPIQITHSYGESSADPLTLSLSPYSTVFWLGNNTTK